MSKKAFPINRVNIDPPKPVRVAPNPPIALPEREPRNIWVMIGVPALIVALIGTIVMLYVSGVRSLATGFFPLMGIGAFSMLAFSGRFGRARKITWGELEKGRRRYLRDLDTNRDEIQTAVCAQREWQNAVHSDPPGLGAIIGGPRMWERGRGDVDFLEVRVGTGVQHAPDSVLSVTWPDISSDEELEPVTGQALRDFILEQRKIRDIAKVVNLRSAPGFSFVSEDLDRVRSLMRSVLCSLAVFHNPRDVKLMVVTRNPEVWAWMVWLPHNLHDELFDACGWRRLIFATPEELEAALGAELHMKGKRGAWTPPTVASPTAMGSALETGQVGVDLGPHLVIVDDNTGSPDAWESVVGQVGKAGLTVLRIASRVGTGVGFAEDQVFEMAQRHGAATAVKAGRDGADADDDQRPAPLLRARGTFFAHADQLSIHRAYRYARAMARWSPTSRSEVTDSTSGAAELLRSLGISDPRELDVDRLWAERRGRGDDRWCEIPVGAKPNGELQNIILRAKDFGGFGFHSVVIGTSGSGKSELGEAVMNRFSPQQAQLTLIDPKTAPHGLRDLHAPGYVRAYAYDQDEIDEVITELAQQILLPRLPPKGLSQEELRALKPWEGPRHFVLIDDVQDLRPAQSYPQKPPVGAALWKLMERARQVGLHVFSTRNSANWATMPMDPWVKSQTSAKVAQLYMDNDPQNRINRSVRAQTLPPGRGLLVGADGDVEGILVGYPSVPGEQ